VAKEKWPAYLDPDKLCAEEIRLFTAVRSIYSIKKKKQKMRKKEKGY